MYMYREIYSFLFEALRDVLFSGVLERVSKKENNLAESVFSKLQIFSYRLSINYRINPE